MTRCLWRLALFAAIGSLCPSANSEQPGLLLARVDARGTFPLPILPTYAREQDASGRGYILVRATAAELAQSGSTYQVLDARSEFATYILAYEFRAGARQAARGKFSIVHDDGKRLVIRAGSGDEVEQLAGLGFQCRRLRSTPMIQTPPGMLSPELPNGLAAVTSNAWVSAMMAQVKQTNLYTALSELTGNQPTVAGGSYTNIRTRYQTAGTPLRRATERAYEHFNALGLRPSYQTWGADGQSTRNVIGVLAGAALPSEIVVICAHIDDMPSSGNAPGADDNASGSLAVLTTAEVLRKGAFERTIRFIIFTGEEQGMLGSASYAAAARAAGDNIVAVLNLDMLAWDGNGDKLLHLYVRPTTDPGYASDLAIASTFTNVVRTYGLHTGLSVRIIAEVSDWSDHYSFQDDGYPAICAIEEDIADFNPYYHTASDTLSRLNLPYYTLFVKAAVGTIAHLARPIGRIAVDSIRVHNGTFQAGTRVGVGTFVAYHGVGAAEDADSHDSAWSGMATNPNPEWLKVYSVPYSNALAIDARPPNSETIYRGVLAAVKTTTGSLTCTNRLKFEFPGGSSTDCTYMVRVTVASNTTPNSLAFTCITNLGQLVADGGFLNLPGLNGVTNGATYGQCEISRRFISRGSSNLTLALAPPAAGTVTLTIPCQLGTLVEDGLEYATNLMPTTRWLPLAAFTNSPAPDASSFESGWRSVQMRYSTAVLSNSPAGYFRLSRRWLSP